MLQYVDGRNIYEGTIIKEMQEAFFNINLDYVSTAFRPIFDKIKNKVLSFKPEPSFCNVLEATEWCIETNLIQQAYSILYEGIITKILKEINIDFLDIPTRLTISASFSIISKHIPKSEWYIKPHDYYLVDLIKKNDFVKHYSSELVDLGKYRNYLMHARYDDKIDITEKKLKTFISKLNNRFKKHISQCS